MNCDACHPQTRYSFPNNMAQFLSMEIWFAIWRAGLSIHVRSCLKIWTPKISWVDHPENPMASHHFPHWNGHLKNPRGAGWKPQAWTSGPCQHPYEGMNWSQSQMWPQMDRVGWDEAIHFYPLVMTFTVRHRKSPFVKPVKHGKASINLWAIEKPWLIMWMS